MVVYLLAFAFPSLSMLMAVIFADWEGTSRESRSWLGEEIDAPTAKYPFDNRGPMIAIVPDPRVGLGTSSDRARIEAQTTPSSKDKG
jgi:hypothetical protein